MMININTTYEHGPLSVFCDFDGTITTEDTIDKLLKSYANDEWMAIEELWQSEKINSRECTERQIACIKRFTEKDMDDFIDGLSIDPYFKSFLELLKSRDIGIKVVSDGFRLIIQRVFQKYKIFDVPIYANELKLAKNTLVPSFPNYRHDCLVGAGNCKCGIMNATARSGMSVYIGDGRSDSCASKHADLLFAKDKLVELCRQKGIGFIEFQNFSDIIASLEILLMEDRIHPIYNGILPLSKRPDVANVRLFSNPLQRGAGHAR